MISAWEINRYLRNGKVVTAKIPGVGEVAVIKARADMAGRIACKTSDDDRFRNIELGSVKVDERTDVKWRVV